MTVGNSEKLQLFSKQFIVVLDFQDIFSHVLDELDVIDLHETLKDVVEYLPSGDGLEFAFQILFNTFCLKLS